MSALPSKVFIDTPLEAYIYRSLLYNTKGEDPKEDNLRRKRNPHYKTSHPYGVKLLAQTIKDELKVDGFDSVREIQDFIGDNYKDHKDLFVSAMEYEITTLKAAAYGYKVEIKDTIETQEQINPTQQENTLKFQTKLKLPKEILQHCKPPQKLYHLKQNNFDKKYQEQIC